MPYISELLSFLDQKGIRTGVISNIGWSGNALFRRINRLLPENHTKLKTKAVQLDLFTDYHELRHRQQAEAEDFAKERRRQEAIIKLRKRFGKNAVLKGLNYAEGATQRERNQQIGGHKA